MRVLLTNNTLAARAGSELYVRDLALALLARGHEPIAYSRRLGEVAEELRYATVPVVDDLERLARPPDLIHAQHHLEAMTALARFPRVPAVYVCHGWLPEEEMPPSHPRLRRYIAVDELVRSRLLDECGLPIDQVVTMLNFVDLERFRARPPLPESPRRALTFSNEASEETQLPALRAACAAAGLTLDVVGLAAGRSCGRPEDLLGEFDLVFAKGRAALEAAAVGAAVVLCDSTGLGPMVTAAELDRLRSLNLGLRLLREPVTCAGVLRQLGRYDAGDAATVTARLRVEASLDQAVDRLLSLYEQVLAEHRAAPSPDTEQEMGALARYLRHGPLRGGDLFQSEREGLLAELAEARRTARDAAARLRAAGEERLQLVAKLELAVASSQCQRPAQECESLRRQLAWINGTATWRLRSGLVSQRWLVAAYRWLAGRLRGAR